MNSYMPDENEVISFLMNEFGMNDLSYTTKYKAPSYVNPEPEYSLSHKILTCLYEWEETNDMNELLKARHYINRLIGENNGG